MGTAASRHNIGEITIFSRNLEYFKLNYHLSFSQTYLYIQFLKHVNYQDIPAPLDNTCLFAVLWDAVFPRENAHRESVFLPAALTEVPHVGNLAGESQVGARPHQRSLGLHQEPLLTLRSI